MDKIDDQIHNEALRAVEQERDRLTERLRSTRHLVAYLTCVLIGCVVSMWLALERTENVDALLLKCSNNFDRMSDLVTECSHRMQEIAR